MRAAEFKEHLTKDIIPYWNRLEDKIHGGFYGSSAFDGTPITEAVKGGILHCRILWFYSSSYTLLKDPKLLAMADHAYEYIVSYFLDKKNGGIYWSLNYDGTIDDSTKHTYHQAFAIYALSAYYEASGKKEAIELARSLFDIIESKCRDEDGYLEAFNLDFTPASNEKLSENGVLADRTMNTLLHIIEAYTEFYRVEKNATVRATLMDALHIFQEKIYNPAIRSCDTFYDFDYNSLIQLESYGHNIEASWLLHRAVTVLDDEALLRKMAPTISELAERAYTNGLEKTDNSQFSMNNECENGVVDHQKIWWVQAESVIGFYNAYQEHPDHEEYRLASEGVWEFIKEKVIDPATGEWYETVSSDGTHDPSMELSHLWKCPYHNGRMCIEMMRRLSGQEPVDPDATKEAKELLHYLHQTAGKNIITGQHTQTNECEELSYIKAVTGKLPKLVGFELLSYSPNINYEGATPECIDEVERNKDTLKTALQMAESEDIIVTFSFHWFSPLYGQDKSFYAKNTPFDPEQVLIEGTPEREAFYHDMDVISEELQIFKDHNIPILWRPFHESDGTWFWWGSKGPSVARDLYLLMYDYFVNVKHLHNLLWVWNCRNHEGYPGDEFVDVISVDIYLEKYEATDYAAEYKKLRQETTRNKVSALAEIGYLPDIELLKNSRIPWAYFMTWSKEFIIEEQYNSKENLKKVYESDYVVKRAQ